MAWPVKDERVTFTPDGVPVSSRFDDPYFSLAGGLAEARHVFLTGNGLPDRLRDGFRVAETGFGTGLNLIALALAWDGTGRKGRLSYTSFELFPMPAADMARAHAAFPDAGPVSAELLPHWAGGHGSFALRGIDVTVIGGDARDTIPAWIGQADAWFLDGFSPAKNPELWQPDLMGAIARHTAPRGSFATYTAAGFVRRGLQAAGFQVSRVPGYGTKRHMSLGRLKPDP